MLFLIVLITCVVTMTVAGPVGNADTIPYNTNNISQPTRRIINGQPVVDTRPYMVYLRAAPSTDEKFAKSDWICGGVIIHERHILTSAACIEDVKHFIVVSGTNKWIPASDKDNECIKNGAKKAIWKCVPKTYVYDGNDFDNMRWMMGDIAVVKVEDAFNFEKRVRGCDFIPNKVAYNNRSVDYEKSGSKASIAGWGSTEKFTDLFQKEATRQQVNSPVLLESEVQLISRKNCRKRWEPRYHHVINDNMVCTKDVSDDETMSGVCADRDINCKELEYSDDDSYADNDEDVPAAFRQLPKTPKPLEYSPEKDETRLRRVMPVPEELKVHTARHLHDARRKSNVPSGGFCENDHGGPLIAGQGKTAMVIGVMSACLTRDISKKCYGPFLFTSVYKHRNLISCAIDKEQGSTCRSLFRTSKTPMVEEYFDWSEHRDLSLRSFGTVKKEKLENKTETKVTVVNVTNETSPDVPSTTMIVTDEVMIVTDEVSVNDNDTEVSLTSKVQPMEK